MGIAIEWPVRMVRQATHAAVWIRLSTLGRGDPAGTFRLGKQDVAKPWRRLPGQIMHSARNDKS